MKFSKKTLIMAACMILCVTMTAFGTVAYLTDRASVANTFTVGNINIIVDEEKVDEYGNSVDIAGKKDVDHDEDPNTPPIPMTKDEYDDWKQNNGLSGEKDYADLPDSKERTEQGNQYKLIPGATYAKDPRMTIQAGNEEAYVRMIVKINKIDELKKVLNIADEDDFLPQNFVTGWDNEIWVTTGEIIKGKNSLGEDANIYEFRYFEKISASNQDQVLDPLFTHMTVPSAITPEQIDKLGLGGLRIEIEGHAIQTAAFEGDNAEDQAWAAFDAQYQPAEGEGNEPGDENGEGA